MCKITVFTATYNRAKLLGKLYQSLKNQTSNKFEWLIVDDDSNDNTSILVKKWIEEEKKFSIRYIKQEHGGKHRALNKGFLEAKGEYFFIVDSDDYLTVDSIERICEWINQIQNTNRKLAGVSGLIAYENGEIIGGMPIVNNEGWIDANCFEREKYRLWGDKAEVFKTSILREHPFPEFENEYFVTEDVCWNSIYAEGYRIRWFNKVIYKAEYLEDGLTKSGMNKLNGHLKNYQGYCFYVKQCINLFGIINRPRMFIDFIKVSNCKNRSFSEKAKDLDINRVVLFLRYIQIPFALVKSFIKVLLTKGISGVINKIK